MNILIVNAFFDFRSRTPGSFTYIFLQIGMVLAFELIAVHRWTGKTACDTAGCDDHGSYMSLPLLRFFYIRYCTVLVLLYEISI